jgi:hypothetical protein
MNAQQAMKNATVTPAICTATQCVAGLASRAFEGLKVSCIVPTRTYASFHKASALPSRTFGIQALAPLPHAPRDPALTVSLITASRLRNAMTEDYRVGGAFAVATQVDHRLQAQLVHKS